jgi:hypothetical protein
MRQRWRSRRCHERHGAAQNRRAPPSHGARPADQSRQQPEIDQLNSWLDAWGRRQVDDGDQHGDGTIHRQATAGRQSALAIDLRTELPRPGKGPLHRLNRPASWRGTACQATITCVVVASSGSLGSSELSGSSNCRKDGSIYNTSLRKAARLVLEKRPLHAMRPLRLMLRFEVRRHADAGASSCVEHGRPA